jgi:hypothetical protein
MGGVRPDGSYEVTLTNASSSSSGRRQPVYGTGPVEPSTSTVYGLGDKSERPPISSRPEPTLRFHWPSASPRTAESEMTGTDYRTVHRQSRIRPSPTESTHVCNTPFRLQVAAVAGRSHH